jgi:hypothetical protein
MDQSDQIVVSKLKKIAIISLVFMMISIVGGALAHSIGIMANAFLLKKIAHKTVFYRDNAHVSENSQRLFWFFYDK